MMNHWLMAAIGMLAGIPAGVLVFLFGLSVVEWLAAGLAREEAEARAARRAAEGKING